MNFSSVGLAEMLDARERRAEIQRALTASTGCPLVCLTMNIAGPVKRTPLVRLLFDEGVRLFEKRFPDYRKREITDRSTGCEAFWAVDADASVLKRYTTELENRFPAARLFDFDVLLPNGEKLSRPEPRSCIVCGGPVQACARSRAHGLDTITGKTNELLADFASALFSDLAVAALYDEVHTTPKPGLVDENNNGAHNDMDIALFERSAEALRPYFAAAVGHGIREGSMPELRKLGLLAEESMYAATNGVNTHKGAVFSMGLLLYGIGSCLVRGGSPAKNAAELLKTERERNESQSTNGAAVRKQHGRIGAYDEALAGFPNAGAAARFLSDFRSSGHPNPGAAALCALMSSVEDTNAYHRCGADGVAKMHREAKRILGLAPEKQCEALRELDAEFIRCNLSPGGCADLLALGYLLTSWQEYARSLFVTE